MARGNWCTVGHDRVVDTLARSMRAGRVAHAYLLAGASQVGKMTLALDIARLVNCVADGEVDKPCGECRQCVRVVRGLHADVRVVSQGGGDGGSGGARTAVGVDQIREVQREATMKPFEGRRRVFIIDGAERFTQEAANALLKTLEEPPDDVVIVLLACEIRENSADETASAVAYPSATDGGNRVAALLNAVPDVGGILPTILSRCQVFELMPLPIRVVAAEVERRFEGVGADAALEIAHLSRGRLGWAIGAAGNPSVLAERAALLDEIQEVIRGGVQERFAYAANRAEAFGRNRWGVFEELELWLTWWRDVLVVGEGGEDYVTNLSLMDALRAAAGEWSSVEAAAGAIRSVLETIAVLESNVNPRLALENMMLSLPEVGTAVS